MPMHLGKRKRTKGSSPRTCLQRGCSCMAVVRDSSTCITLNSPIFVMIGIISMQGREFVPKGSDLGRRSMRRSYITNIVFRFKDCHTSNTSIKFIMLNHVSLHSSTPVPPPQPRYYLRKPDLPRGFCLLLGGVARVSEYF